MRASWSLFSLAHSPPAVYHGENGVRTLKELARSYLSITQDLTRVNEPVESSLQKLGDSVCGRASLRTAPP